ncbi:hypothetical protein POM88_012991 [Heracleum sosnowskyi]|uniref:Uncharacterized protein n=1 Tax=Heracleum sosnowskyi TaxID=360622 RepID=A0AAD8IXR6_9APIA|nr:hypothetical protein POM88_012991 [Heracleum sosnowskyi]
MLALAGKLDPTLKILNCCCKHQGTIGEFVRCNADHYSLGRNDTVNYAFDVSSTLENHRNFTKKNCRALIISGDHYMLNDISDQRDASALHDELDMLKEENDLIFEKRKIVVRKQQLELRSLRSRKEAALRKREKSSRRLWKQSRRLDARSQAADRGPIRSLRL